MSLKESEEEERWTTDGMFSAYIFFRTTDSVCAWPQTTFITISPPYGMGPHTLSFVLVAQPPAREWAVLKAGFVTIVNIVVTR